MVPALWSVLFNGLSLILLSISATKSEILALEVPMGTVQTSAMQASLVIGGCCLMTVCDVCMFQDTVYCVLCVFVIELIK